MPPRVTYWTGQWEPAREALSKEVQALRSALAPGARVVSFSRAQRTRLRAEDGVIRLSARRYLLLRILASVLERASDISHMVDGLSAWHLLRALGRRPLLFTVALPSPIGDPRLLGRVSLFAAETEVLAADLREAGVPASRIEVIPPGLDLDHFAPLPLPSPSHPLRLLFASTPQRLTEMDVRGIPLLVETARRMPDVELVMLWRTWGDVEAARRAIGGLRLPANVRVEYRDTADIRQDLASVHATVCCFAGGFGKSCPNSVVEGLACGRPAVLSDTVGIAPLLQAHGAGVVSERTVDALVTAIDALRANLPGASVRARELAERTFGLREFCRRYQAAYETVAAQAPAARNRVRAARAAEAGRP